MIEINSRLVISEREISYIFSRSPGAGGQNVNKVNTRVTLRFDVDNSPSLTSEEKKRLKARLSSRINNQGIMQVTSFRYRSQGANRNAALARFAELLSQALAEKKPRKKTRMSAAAKRRRLEDKRRRARLKEGRGRVRNSGG